MRVKPSSLLTLLLGLLLPVPLLLIVGTAFWNPWSEEGLRAAAATPILELEETWKLQTYSQACWRGQDCEPPLGCLGVSGTRREGLCSDSWCTTDLQCGEGETCRTLPTLDDGPLVRVCVDSGERKEGEACIPARGPGENTCEQGLHCNRAWCGRRCELKDPQSCPQGFFCREGLDGPSCLPTCEVSGCAEGQECVTLREGISVCAVVRGENCQKVPCSGGGLCSVWPPRYKDSRLELKMACSQISCSDGGPGCPPGTSCVQGLCRHPCDPGMPDAGPTVCPPRHP